MISDKLRKAVIKQFGGWRAFKSAAPAVCQHGIDGGFAGFICYSDTTAFFKKNKADILFLAKDQAEESGQSMLEMINYFRCLGGELSIDEIAEGIYTTGGDVRVANALAWFAAEEVCREYCDKTGQ